MRKFKVSDIAAALDRSQSAITAAASSRDWSCRGGLDIMQIRKIAQTARRTRSEVDKTEVALIQAMLETMDEIEGRQATLLTGADFMPSKGEPDQEE